MPLPFKFAWKWPDWLRQGFRRAAGLAGPVLLAAVVLSAAAASWNRSFEIYELQTYDWRNRFLPKSPPFPQVLMIQIADDTLNKLGRWPIDRGYHAKLLDALRDNGAALVAFDVLFAEPSPSDDVLAKAASDFNAAYFCDVLKSPVSRNGRRVSASVEVALLDDLRRVSAGVGYVNAIPDVDGKIRRVAPVIWVDDQPHFHLSVLLAMDRLGVKKEEVTFGKGYIDLGGKRRIPVDENGDSLIRFNGKWSETFEHTSFVDLYASYLQSEIGEPMLWDLSRLKDRVCIVGLTAVASHDMNPVPLEPRYPQVGIYSNYFENVLNQNFLSRAPRWCNLFVAILLGWGGWVISRVRRLALGVSVAVGIWAGFIALAVVVFMWANWWIDLFFPSMLWWGVYLSAIVWRTMQEMRKRELLEAELSIASKIQRSFLPAALPTVEGYEMEVFMRPAKHVGGDLYAAVKLDENHLGLMCGDVSGKGMPAALFMARSVAEFKFSAALGLDPAAALFRLNNGLADAESSGLFVTMNYAVVDLRARTLVLSNGGHMPVLRIRANGEADQLSPDGGMPIGLVGDVDFGRLETPLSAGDIFIMYSDGISEARNRKAQDFEIERMIETAVRWRQEPASSLCARLVQAVDQFAAGAPQHDDMTLFVFKVRD